MKILDKLKNIKENLNAVKKLNEDIVESHLAKKNKIDTLNKKIKILKNGINESANEIEKFIKDSDANFKN
tara:strand:- start:42 stop:251 length:210 start_codon:yes stop_codon:yes gene_type:complete